MSAAVAWFSGLLFGVGMTILVGSWIASARSRPKAKRRLL